MSFTLATFVSVLLPAITIIAIAVLFGRQVSALQRRTAATPDWAADLSVERYRPMFRLLTEDDLRFVLAQPGVTPQMVRRLRRQRCEVFRGYLRSLEKDFRQTSDALFLVMVAAQSDRRDLISVLLGCQLKFFLGVLALRSRLMLYHWNVGVEPVARLVGLFGDLQRELQLISARQQAAGA